MSEVIEWKPDQMLEVKIKEPDDFLKIRGVRSNRCSRKEERYINLVIYYINKVDISLYI